jgi:hypothetical protein
MSIWRQGADERESYKIKGRIVTWIRLDQDRQHGSKYFGFIKYREFLD